MEKKESEGLQGIRRSGQERDLLPGSAKETWRLLRFCQTAVSFWSVCLIWRPMSFSEETGRRADILYLSKNPQNITQATINALEDRNRIVLIDSLQNLQDTCCLVTTTSHIAYAYAFYYQKPAIFFMPSFNSIDIDAPQFIMLQIIALFAHSLESLKEQVLFCMRDSSKGEEIAEFLGRSLI